MATRRVSEFIGWLRLSALTLAPTFALANDATETFETKVRPILAEHCYECHLRDSKGGFRLDSGDSAIAGGESGPAIVPGQPENSPLIHRIRREDPDSAMPPKTSLSNSEVETLTEWVRQGAVWPESKGIRSGADETSVITEADRSFWAFQPLDNTIDPPSSISSPPHPIDAFLHERHRELGLTPVSPASRRVLARRVHYDLIGLPPTPDDVETFVRDNDPNALDRLVERLLSSSQYGERWGGHWLDLVRYADTAGDGADFPVPEAYKYRNYVIDAFNQDKPYDQFIKEQIAGDLLPAAENDDERWERMIATGYLAISRRIGVSPHELKHLTIEDTIDNLGKTFLGLSLACARCHDHKFDPIPTTDYYALYGIFASSIYPHAGAEHQPYRKDFVYRLGQEKADDLLAPYREKLKPWDAKEREALRVYRSFQSEKVTTPGLTRESTWEDLLRIRDQRREIAETFPNLEIAFAIQDGKPQDAHVQKYGDPSERSRGALVPRRFLSILGGKELPNRETGSGRRQLAQWIADPTNPLTARVMANRVWKYHFGRGIVETPSDFGVRGARPTNPPLLDYLARYFINSGWSIKALHRHILSSQAYQRSADANAANHAIDAENLSLWRFPRQRLSAEQLRDSFLFLSGELDLNPGARHPMPHHLTYFYRQHEPFLEDYDNNKRTIYQLRRRLEKDPYLDLFDGPDGNQHFANRRATTTTLQALFFMNSDFVENSAQAITRRWFQPDDHDAKNLNQLFLALYIRPVSAEEQERLLAENRRLSTDQWTSLVKSILSSNEFLFID